MNSAARATLTLAHSPDPDDVFMWWPITGKIDPARNDGHGLGVVVEPPRLDTGRFTFRAMAEDISVLNRRAIERADLDITALSMFTWAGTSVRDRYQLTACGSSMGEGYGPKVVCRRGEAAVPARKIAVPGRQTTAFLLWNMWKDAGPGTSLATAADGPAILELPFDQIMDAVRDGRADHGLLIHQSQLTYVELGLDQLVDLGQWWGERTGLPLPLGGNAVRRDLESRLGPGSLHEIAGLLESSIRCALDNREESIRYAMRFAPELDLAQAERYIEMYVSPLTVDMGDRGAAALARLLAEGARLGMCEEVGRIDLLRGK